MNEKTENENTDGQMPEDLTPLTDAEVAELMRRHANFFYFQMDVASQGLAALKMGEYATVESSLHTLRAGSAHKIASEYPLIVPPGAAPDVFTSQGDLTRDQAAALQVFRDASLRVQALAEDSPYVSPYLESLISLIDDGLYAPPKE